MPRLVSRRSLTAGLAILSALSVLAWMPVTPAAAARAMTHRSKRVALPAMGPSLRSAVAFATTEPAGTIVIRTEERALSLVTSASQALRYRISVGREGFGWTGTVKVGGKQEWPEWRPPADMLERPPNLPEFFPAGPANPPVARALSLFKIGPATLFRITGSNDPGGVGSTDIRCFRLINTDVIDLYKRVA